MYEDLSQQQIDWTRRDSRPGAKAKAAKHEYKVMRFVGGVGLQEFCNLPANKVHDRMLMQIACCLDNVYYVLSSGKVVDDFRINLAHNEGLRLYKMERYINRPNHPSEIRCFFTATYWITKKGGYWDAELILDNDEELSRKAVKKAFSRIAELKGYTLSENVRLNAVTLSIPPAGSFETKAWAQKAVNADGEEITLFCLLDNGRIVEAAEHEILKQEPCRDNVVRTKFNWFAPGAAAGDYERLKS